jgi:predicted amidohydrolase YtcJ
MLLDTGPGRYASSVLLRDLRLPSSPEPISLRTERGLLCEIGPGLTRRAGEEVLDVQGALALPGLWDHHVHVGQTAQGYTRVDMSGIASVDEVLRRVTDILRNRTGDPRETLVGFGHRLVDMAGEPTVAALDAATEAADRPDVPVVLVGGDAHHAWMNSAALRGLGLPEHRGVVAEDEWFDAVAHLEDLPGIAAHVEAGVRHLQDDALARGVVGITDMEWARNWDLWAQRETRIRVRCATYSSDMPVAPGPTGAAIGESGLVTMGPLKVIADGSLGSRSAYCRHPYAFSAPVTEESAEEAHGGYGVLSEFARNLADLLTEARECGLEAAVHAIGDAAVEVVLDAFEVTRTTGRIEHAQLLTDEDVRRMARLGATASVQPAHLLDDRDPTMDVWPEQAAESFRLRDLVDAGVPLLMGSDSPVAPVDPWLAMAAAVHRTADDRPAWYPAQQLQPAEALAASTNGIAHLAVGGVADVVLVEDPDQLLLAPVPLDAAGIMDEGAAREAATRLREASVLATVVDGAVAFSS